MSTAATPVTGSKLAAKLAKILGEVGKVPKTGYNSFHKYNYVTENDLVYAVRDKLAAEGVFVFTSVEEQHSEIITAADGKQSLLTKVVTLHTFVDGETGETFSVKSQGQGSDNGDKGGYKAITGAMKYFLYKCFMIPTGDDPEGDDKTDERTAAGVTEKTSTAGSAPRSTSSARSSSPEVPRDAEVDDIKRFEAEYEDNKWTGVKIHFGKDKGIPLGKMESAKLTWWIENYKPEPFRGKFADADLALRAALNVADVEWK